jgi:formylglycine-generating enzyme required for sulfatase activity
VAVTVALLVIFGLVWRYGDTSLRSTRNAALDATTRDVAAIDPKVPRSSTGPGYGRREVATRPFEDLREVTNSVGMTMREVPRTLGLVGNADDPDGDAPMRVVKTDPFFIGTAEVTRAQWKRISGAFSDPSIYIGAAATNDELPVNNVDFPEAIRFCKLLTAREGRNYRLPTEYEWEIACWGRRTNAIFACRAAMRIAKVVASEEYERADAAAREAQIEESGRTSLEAARQDLVRLGYSLDDPYDTGASLGADLAIRIVKARVREALAAEPIPTTGGARRSRVFDAVLAEELVELRMSRYARGTDASAARFEASSPEDWFAYGRYQAAWWTDRDPAKPQGHPLGLQDMLGSMMEWTTTPTMPYPYAMTLSEASAEAINRISFEEANIPMSRWATLDELSRFSFNRTLRDKTFYIVRGGSFERAVESCTPWNRYGQLPLRTRFTAHRESLGFRVVLEP